MKKKILFILLTIFLIIVPVIMIKKDNTYIMEDKKEHKVLANTIALMYETEPSSGIYETSKDNTWPTSGYTFNATLSKCENGSELSWDNESKKVIMTGNVADKCYVYFNKEIAFAEYIKSLYTVQGENNIYHHTTALADSAEDNSYRYAGASDVVNNWVCFGSNADTCPEDNLYRIIGVFDNDKVKLIKATSIGNIAFDENGKNNWVTSTLRARLNNNTAGSNGFLASLDDKWDNMIETSIFYLGGNNSSPSISNFYKAERRNSTYLNNPAIDTQAKVGLMYPSDYGFATKNIEIATEDGRTSSWGEYITNYDEYYEILSNNWLYKNAFEWTITPSNFCSEHEFYISNDGSIGFTSVLVSHGETQNFLVGARPVFYLKTTINYLNGTGTISDPYRIS